MKNKRNIQPVVWKGTFAEAESRDDIFWANADVRTRMEALMAMREQYKKIFLGENFENKIQRVVNKKHISEQEEG